MTRTQMDLRTMLMDRAGDAAANPVRATEVRARIALARRRRARRVVASSATALALAATGLIVAPHLGHGAPTERGTPVAAHHGGSTSAAYSSSLEIAPGQPALGMPEQAWGGHLIGEATLLISSPSATQSVSTFTPMSWDLTVSAVCEPALPIGQSAQLLINGREFVRASCTSAVSGGGSAGPDHTPEGLQAYWTTHFDVHLAQPSTLGVRVVDEDGEPVADPPLGTTVSAGIYARTTIPAPHTP